MKRESKEVSLGKLLLGLHCEGREGEDLRAGLSQKGLDRGWGGVGWDWGGVGWDWGGMGLGWGGVGWGGVGRVGSLMIKPSSAKQVLCMLSVGGPTETKSSVRTLSV